MEAVPPRLTTPRPDCRGDTARTKTKETKPPKKKKARGAYETRRGLKGSLLLEEIYLNYRVFYKSCKLFLGAVLFFGAENPIPTEVESTK